MGAQRNGNQTRTNNIAIQPAYTPIFVPAAATTTTNTPQVAGAPTPFMSTTVSSITTAPVITVPIGPSPIADSMTTANIPLPVLTINTTTVTPNPKSSGVSMRMNTKQDTVLVPIIALTGKAQPFVAPPVIFRPKPSPVKLLTQNDMVEETLSLDTYTFVNGQPVLDVSRLRGEIITLTDFKPIYSPLQYTSTTRFGTYFNDLYQSSLIRDTLRKYLLLNRATVDPQFNSILNSISTRVNQDIERSRGTIRTLDGLIRKIKEINNVLDLKNNMDTAYAFRTPYLGLRNFVTQRMLFSEQSYNGFSDTKVLYQLLFDLSGILEKCSFNLLSNFTDADRSAYVSNPASSRQQRVQDSITLDLTYGDNLLYTSDAIQSKYISDYVTFNGILNVLPASSTDRFKFLVNLLSKEFRVSKGLGKYDIPEAGFFGFGNQGNPFDNVIGSAPSDIFVAPLGNNSLSTLFYLRTSTQNAVVLPFESRQVAGDGETVFVPGTNYFSDGILNGDFSTYNSYRETFSDRITKARNVFNKLLLQQDSFDSTSNALKSNRMLQSILQYYVTSQDLVRGNNNDSTNLLSFVLFSLGNSSPRIKFEVYKLLLLVILYDTRKTVTQDIAQTDKFRDLLLSELSQQNIQGFSEPLTENNIPKLLDNQIAIVRQLTLKNVAPLPPSVSVDKPGTGLSKNQSKIKQQNQQKQQLGKQVPATPSKNRNPENNLAQVQVQQFSNLIYSLRTTNNLFKNVLDMCKQMFSAASTNETPYHLLPGSSVTRYNGLTLSGFVLLMFELFSNLVDQFSTRNMTYNLVESDQNTKAASTQYIQINFVGDELSQISADIRNFVRGASQYNTTLTDYGIKLEQEDQIIENIFMFFEQLNNRFTSVVAPTNQEITTIREINTNNPNSLSTTRTAKSIIANIINKKTVYNPNNSRALDFYLPAGKAISDRNWAAVTAAMKQNDFVGSTKRKIVTVGVPYGFVKSALGARLNKNEVNNGKLEESTSDLINIKIYRLDKNNDGIIYKPQQFKFDLSLFAKGFDAYPVNQLSNQNYYSLKDLFQFYDFDEDQPFDEVTAKTTSEFVASDVYYNASIDRRLLGTEVSENLYRSFLLDMYVHVTTGLNTSEETFISYTEQETTQFVTEMQKIQLGTADLTKVKFMTPEYSNLLSTFQANNSDSKLMLTLCNDITKTVFRQKDYDRVFNILYDINKFPIDGNAMSQTVEGDALLQKLINTGKAYTSNGEIYKKAEELLLDSYFINVELIG